MKEKINKNRKFVVGVSLIIIATLLIPEISIVIGADFSKNSSSPLSETVLENIDSLESSLVPHPIYGTATWEGGGNADGASVVVTNSLGTVLPTTVSSGAWQVDCGDPGANWPIGTSFTVTIIGSGSHPGWSGSASGTVSGYSNNMGNIVVYNDAPSNPSTPSGPTTRDIGQSGDYCTSATDSGEQVQYMFDWDASGSHSYSSWTSLVPSGQSVCMSYSWSSPGTYVVKAQAKDEHGKTSSGWSSGLTVVVNPINNAPGIPSTPSGSTHLIAGQSASYSTSAIDSDNDHVQFMFDWDASGSHSYSSWTNLVASGQSGSMSHSWGSPGTYVVKAKARDEHGLESNGWSGGLTVTVTLNNPPNTPSTPTGPTSGVKGTPYTYSTNTIDPNGDKIRYGWDWNGDGTVDQWDPASGYYNSGTTSSLSHSWSTAGTYNVQVKAEDSLGAQSSFSSALPVTITSNPPNKPSKPSGETNGKIGVLYTYTTSTTDPDGDQVYYWFDWGDGTNSGWVGPFASGVIANAGHTWTTKNTYSIKVEAKDTSGAVSVWSDPLSVTMPTSYSNGPEQPLPPANLPLQLLQLLQQAKA